MFFWRQYVISEPHGRYGFTDPNWFRFPAAELYDWALLGDIIEFIFNIGNCECICWLSNADWLPFDVIWPWEPIDDGGGILIVLCNELSDWLMRESLNDTEEIPGKESWEDMVSWSDWLACCPGNIAVIEDIPFPGYWLVFREFIVVWEDMEFREFQVVFWSVDFTDDILWVAKHWRWLSNRSLSGSWRSMPSTVMR